ncbi:helix-turn-helix domain-containing protein [Streptacidiphilus sp. P02-A3a]|uniref:helix-turn-helix domain-containing protein n=1 Tax=Streptacidiphilus sp. P02-A3a TaxID=2704468 RepID=UPI001CDCB73F|nr:helix-turn-helix transcriptional regulator [Streptacidiphilus sp. P02-A3a]
MTDLPTGLTTGERIRAVRERRGMTRPVLAGLVGRGAVWLKKIESGERELHSITMLVKLASALHLDDVSALTGGTSVPVTSGKLSHESVPLIREAMHTVAFLPRPPG